MSERLKGITADQQRELETILVRLAQLWSELAAAASRQDRRRVENIHAEIAVCRKRVEQIKRSGTHGSA